MNSPCLIGHEQIHFQWLHSCSFLLGQLGHLHGSGIQGHRVGHSYKARRILTLECGGDGLQQFLQRFHLIGNEHRTLIFSSSNRKLHPIQNPIPVLRHNGTKRDDKQRKGPKAPFLVRNLRTHLPERPEEGNIPVL